MKALVKFDLGPGGMEIREVPKPVPKDGELLVKVLAAGICGSDIHARHDEREVRMPVTLGHEFVGQIVETKGDVGSFRTGDWIVTLPACYSCGECYLCKQGLVTLCAKRTSIGSHVNGAMAEYVVVPAKYSFRIPDDAGDKAAYALVEPMGCVARGVYERIGVKPGDVAVGQRARYDWAFCHSAFKITPCLCHRFRIAARQTQACACAGIRRGCGSGQLGGVEKGSL